MENEDILWTDEISEFASLFHAALRKAADGHGSTICWNAVHFLRREDWFFFAHKMISEFDGAVTRASLRKCARYGNAALNIFSTGLEIMTNDEAESIASWIEYAKQS